MLLSSLALWKLWVCSQKCLLLQKYWRKNYIPIIWKQFQSFSGEHNTFERECKRFARKRYKRYFKDFSSPEKLSICLQNVCDKNNIRYEGKTIFQCFCEQMQSFSAWEMLFFCETRQMLCDINHISINSHPLRNFVSIAKLL